MVVAHTLSERRLTGSKTMTRGPRRSGTAHGGSRRSDRSPARMVGSPVEMRVSELLALSPYRYALVPTGWGTCGVLWRLHSCPMPGTQAFEGAAPDALLCRIITPGMGEAELSEALGEQCPGPGKAGEVLPDAQGKFHAELVPTWFAELVGLLTEYFAPELHPDLPPAEQVWAAWRGRLDWSQLTEFQRQVLELVGQIPVGQVLTYGQVAAKLGRPGAARAVGAALGANPWPVLIPCHRVIGCGGTMRGFSAPGGVMAKQRMLAREQGH